MSTMDRHTCAVCDTPIGPSFLMCARHWHMVPRELKQRVYSGWFALQRHGGPRCTMPHLLQAYQAARDEAVLVVARMVAGEERPS